MYYSVRNENKNKDNENHTRQGIHELKENDGGKITYSVSLE